VWDGDMKRDETRGEEMRGEEMRGEETIADFAWHSCNIFLVNGKAAEAAAAKQRLQIVCCQRQNK